jgi:hypothetical protein
VTALYQASENVGLLELWEPSNDQGNIKVQLADLNRLSSGDLDLTGKYQEAAKRLVTGLNQIFCRGFDCSGAVPFDGYKSSAQYYKQRDFGRVALATYAHYIFGHVDATAAITNDKEFVEYILSLNDKGNSEVATERAAAFKKVDYLTQPVQAWDASYSGTDANLAVRLIKKLVQKGLSDETASGTPIESDVNAQNTASLANIVSQVVGQDASRLMNEDNSQRTLDQHMLLRFYAGDVIYMNIKLVTPDINIGAANRQLVSKQTLESMFVESNFTLKITLA